jgi:hypothetical protein
MTNDVNIENTGVKVEIDSKIPETVDAVQKIIPRTLTALDKLGESLLTVGGLPLLLSKEYASHYLTETKQKLAQKLASIPENQIHPPKMYMANPLLQDMFSYMDNESLHNLFVNLLASSMDSAKDRLVHPAFVSVIKNLSPLDASALTSSTFKNTFFPVYTVMFQKKSSPHELAKTVGFPFKTLSVGQEILSHVANFSDVNIRSPAQDINTILDNLIRQGLIEIDKSQFLTSESNYKKDISFLWGMKKEIESHIPENAPKDRELAIIPALGRVTSFGRNFLQACVY